MTTDADEANAAYCVDQVKRFDYDRWLVGLFSPAPVRRAAYALFAFNIELARTCEQVSDPMLGEIRLQWWREAIDGIYDGSPRAQPIIRELATAVAKHGLTREHFDRAIDGRVEELYDSFPSDIAAVEACAAATEGSLMSLWLEALAINDEQSKEAARLVAIGWALTGIARSDNFDTQHRRIRLPLDVQRTEGPIIEDATTPGQQPSAIALAIVAMADRATEQLAKARLIRVVPEARPALLLGSLAELYLKRLRRTNNPEDIGQVLVTGPRKQLCLLRHALIRRF